MPITIGLDLGTTTISAVAVDATQGTVLAAITLENDGNITPAADRARGYSEWDAAYMLSHACEALKACTDGLGRRRSEVCGIGVTGQQHGVVILDETIMPLTPFINWQDQRGEETIPGGEQTYAELATSRVGPEATQRAGCQLATGFMGTTLFWLRERGELPARGTACFAADFIAARLASVSPVTDPTNGASSGLFDLYKRTWDDEAISRLGLPRELFPPVGEAGDHLRGLCPAVAEMTGLPAGLPVFVGLGDNQASFLGSVAHRDDTVLVNVGTGAQVARYTDCIKDAPPLETRPFARSGYLLVYAGLSGGRSYATLERFFRQVAADVMGCPGPESLYERMNALALKAPPGCDGLRCEPYFAGSRSDPTRRASVTGVSDSNLTPAHLVRAVLEGLARSFYEGCESIQRAIGTPCHYLVGAGNGLRKNAVLAQAVAEEFNLPLAVPQHREEAAYGAAVVAAFGADIWPDLASAAQIIQYRQA